MSVPIYVVDSFTSRPFHGNPAGVCLVREEHTSDWMAKVASEMRHAETAFVRERDGRYQLRWFTPTVEVDLCGHATLAAAHILWEIGDVEITEPIAFDTLSGVLSCTKHGYGIQLDFPAEPAEYDESITTLVANALGLTSQPLFVGKNRMDILVEIENATHLRALEPNMDKLGALGGRGVIVTCLSDKPDYDFKSRFFAPAAGVPEDPVTGSAHCCLGPYWSKKLGKDDVIGFQASARGGAVRAAVRGDRVLLQGSAITVLRGTLLA